MFEGRRVAVSGIRDLDPNDEHVVESVIADIVGELPHAMIFGGARGVDTIALAAAGETLPNTRLVVVVPGGLDQQPAYAQRVIRTCADEIDEMSQPALTARAYFARNCAMLDRADVLVAFWDGTPGGTANTIREAKRRGLPVVIVEVRRAARRLRINPPITFPCRVLGLATPAPVIALDGYVSAADGRHTWSKFVRDLKTGNAKPFAVVSVAEAVGGFLRPVGPCVLVPVPRHDPTAPNDLAPIVREAARRSGCVADGTGVLTRRAPPAGGFAKWRRVRNTVEEHAASMAVDTAHSAARQPGPFIVFDNVLTTGATMTAAVETLRVFPDRPVYGLALLLSRFWDGGTAPLR